MRKIIFLPLILLCACVSAPKNFTQFYQNENTELPARINIDGYYVSQHGCDGAFYSMYMFYPNGLFTIATTSKVSQDLIDCFTNGGTSTICQYPLWGTYKIEGDTIRTQTIRPEGGGCIIFRDYIITEDRDLVNISDYVEAGYTMMAYMQNYPSFRKNECAKPAKFFPLANKRSFEDCPFVHQGWFKKK